MKKLILLIFLLAVAISAQDIPRERCKFPERMTARAQKMLKAQYPGDASYDVTYYKLDVTVTHTPSFIGGAVTINAKALSSPTSEIFFDLQDNLTVDSVLINDIFVPFTHSNNKITISGLAFSQDEAFSAVIYYHGTPGSSGLGSYAVEYHNNGTSPIVWTLSEPYGASDWFPCKDTPADKADSSDVWITADEYYTVVSNGILEEIIDNGDQTKTTKWKSRYPIAQYLISFAMTNYQLYTNYFHYTETDSMPVMNYSYPERWDALRKVQLDEAISMLEVYSDLYGLYPFINEKYGHAEFGWGGAMEHQTASTMGAFYDLIVAHEMSHQWFGDKITCADWHNIWLNEGFATYSEALYLEARDGRAAYLNQINSEIGQSNQWWTAKGAVGTIYVQNIEDVGEIFNGARSYSKGGVVLHMLRGVLGDEKFFDVIKTYASYPGLEYDVAVTEDFQGVAEEVSGIDLDYFFQEWIYGENYPVYSLDYSFFESAANETTVKIKVEQATNTNPAFFTMPLQFKITNSDIDSVFVFFNDSASQEFEVVIPGGIPTVKFDPDSWIMKDVTSLTNVGDPDLLDDYRLEQNFPNPFNPSTMIYYSVPESGKVTIRLYDITGAMVAVLLDEVKERGTFHLNLDVNSVGRNISSGVYFYSLEAGGKMISKKMTLMK